MNCLIVDDNELSRKSMKHLVSQVHYLNLSGICCNAAEALNFLSINKIDLMLLDIDMPDMNGLELIRSHSSPPLTILATSKIEYAIEAFECNVSCASLLYHIN